MSRLPANQRRLSAERVGRWLRHLLLVATTSAVGCAATSATVSVPTAQSSVHPSPEQHVSVALVVSPAEVLAAADLLARAELRLAARQFELARADYRRLLAAPTAGPLRCRAAFGLGRVEVESGNQPAALAAYQLAVPERACISPEERTAGRGATMAAIRLLLLLDQARATAALGSTLSARDLSPLDQVVLLVAQARRAVEAGALEQADRELMQARTLLEDLGADRALEPCVEVAMTFFAQGEVLRTRAQALNFEPVPEALSSVLEERSRLILAAQSAYAQAMRSPSSDYAAMSGVRVGELYRDLHRDLLSAPHPASVTTPEGHAFVEGALRVRYAILLAKAVTMLEATTAMLARRNEQSLWRERAELTLRELRAELEEGERALKTLPYSRAELEDAMGNLDLAAAGVAHP